MEILCEVKSDDKWMNQQKKKTENHFILFCVALLRKGNDGNMLLYLFTVPRSC